jgi:hypothetical protein
VSCLVHDFSFFGRAITRMIFRAWAQPRAGACDDPRAKHGRWTQFGAHGIKSRAEYRSWEMAGLVQPVREPALAAAIRSGIHRRERSNR